MARITVEDCLQQVDNRFDLVLDATRRARQLFRGRPPRIAAENDKPTVLALREIAAGMVTKSMLDEEDLLTKQFDTAGSAIQPSDVFNDEPMVPGDFVAEVDLKIPAAGSEDDLME